MRYFSKIIYYQYLITVIYTIGILSSLYADLLVPKLKTTAVMASGLIDGVATILLIIFTAPRNYNYSYLCYK